MNVQDYRAAGYALSAQIDQVAITRAENDVLAAYILPLYGNVPTDAEKAAEPLKSAIMALSFLLIMQRSAVATRAGAKIKQTAQSSTPDMDDLLRQNAPTCVRYLQACAGEKEPHRLCSDICGIFFRTNFFYSR